MSNINKSDNLDCIELVTVNIDFKQLNFQQIHSLLIRDAKLFSHVKRIFQSINKQQVQTPKNSVLRVQIVGSTQEVSHD